MPSAFTVSGFAPVARIGSPAAGPTKHNKAIPAGRVSHKNGRLMPPVFIDVDDLLLWLLWRLQLVGERLFHPHPTAPVMGPLIRVLRESQQVTPRPMFHWPAGAADTSVVGAENRSRGNRITLTIRALALLP